MQYLSGTPVPIDLPIFARAERNPNKYNWSTARKKIGPVNHPCDRLIDVISIASLFFFGDVTISRSTEEKVMKRPKKDPVREDRIHLEAIADANGPEEQVMGWHCYLDDKIGFPFQAKCIAIKVVSPLRKGESVEVLGMAPEDACSADMLVLNPLERPERGGSLVPTDSPRH